jgi:2-keto-3-deoxy-L-rhamnonate aldolase RhmA
MVGKAESERMLFKNKLKTAELVLGTWVSSSDPLVSEAVAQSAFEFLIVDCEHGLMDTSAMLMNLIVARAAGNKTLVRLADNDTHSFMRALDGGADGLLLPRVETVEEVRRAVEICKYPPVGKRGFGPLRAASYYRDIEGYTATANDSFVVIVQIETAQALEALDGILAVEGLDGVLVGRNDLAGSLGLPRDHANAELNAISAQILAKAKQRGMIRAIATGGGGETTEHLMSLNANVIAAGGYIEYMVSGMDAHFARLRDGWSSK